MYLRRDLCTKIQCGDFILGVMAAAARLIILHQYSYLELYRGGNLGRNVWIVCFWVAGPPDLVADGAGFQI
jgi:hypothetical protein